MDSNMKHPLRLVLALIIVHYLISCSYVVNGKYHNVTIRDTNQVAINARVINRAGEACYDGAIPVQLSLKKGNGFMRREQYEVCLYDRDGDVLSIDTINFHRSKSYWANLFFLNYPGFLIVDPCTGAMWLSTDTLCEPPRIQHPYSPSR